MSAKFLLLQKAITFSAFVFLFFSTTDAFSSDGRLDIRNGNIPLYTKGMRMASNEIHDEGRKYIGVAAPSLKTEHYTMRLDSIDKTTDLTRREFYHYDENFRIALTHETVYAWDQEWINWWQFFYEYNDLGYITLAYDNRWDNFIKEWVPWRKYEYTYNESNNLTLYVSYSWNIENKEWQFIGKDEFTYTPFYFIQEVVNSSWKHLFGGGGRWVPWFKDEYIYNNSFTLMEVIGSSWGESSDKWRLLNRIVYERISLGRKSVETIYTLDDDEWIAYKKYEYTYPSGNNFNILTKKGSLFDWWETQEWENTDSLAFTYHPVSGFIESENYYYWRTQDSIWLFSQKDDYLYDENFNLINYQRKRWSQIQNDWEPYIEEQASFNSSNLSAEYIVKPFWYEWTNMIDEYKRRLWEFDKWKETNHRIFYYSPLDATSVNQTREKVFQIYPNPAREIINIDFSGVNSHVIFELYNLSGKRIISATISGSTQLNLDGLKEGLYIYQMIIPGQNHISGKLLISGK